jgi:hypothetical protein
MIYGGSACGRGISFVRASTTHQFPQDIPADIDASEFVLEAMPVKTNVCVKETKMQFGGSVWLRVATMVCSLIVSALPHGASALAQAACQIKVINEIHFNVDEFDNLWTEVEIEGQKARMIINAASGVITLNERFLAKLDKHSKTLERFKMLSVAKGETSARGADIDQMTIGRDTGSVKVFATTGDPEDRYDGVIGANYLWAADLEFDPAAHMIRLIEPSDCEAPVYWADEFFTADLWHPRFDNDAKQSGLFNFRQGIKVTSGGENVSAMIGLSGRTKVTDRFVKALGLDDRIEHGPKDPVDLEPGQTGPIGWIVVPDIEAGSIQIKNNRARVIALPKVHSPVTGRIISTDVSVMPMITLGWPFMKNFRAYISRKHDIMYFTMAK